MTFTATIPVYFHLFANGADNAHWFAALDPGTSVECTAPGTDRLPDQWAYFRAGGGTSVGG